MVTADHFDEPPLGKGLVATSSGPFDILGFYSKTLDSDPDVTMPIAAIESLVALLDFTSGSVTTVSEFLTIIEQAIKVLKSSVPNAISLSAGCDLFLRYIVRGLEDKGDFDACRAHLLANGRLFVERAKQSRWKIAQFGQLVIKDNSAILLHSHSRVVIAFLLSAAMNNIRFRVIVTETRPSCSGLTTARILRGKDIPVSVIPDNCVGYVISKVDTVIMGAEGVVENGGIINAMGTYTIAVLAQQSKKPFYVLAETHKFVRLFPLDQFDLPVQPRFQRLLDFTTDDVAPFSRPGTAVAEEFAFQDQFEGFGGEEVKTKGASRDRLVWEAQGRIRGGKGSAPLVDYTRPSFITAIISEGGVMTPSAVSEELIKIYS